MHFAENPVSSPIFIQAYNPPLIKTTQGEFQSPIVLFDNTVLTLLPDSFTDLTTTHLENLANLKPELILIGSGKTHQQLHPSLCEPIFKNRIGLEVMTTDAACRTFNILLSEDRAVLAALFI